MRISDFLESLNTLDVIITNKYGDFEKRYCDFIHSNRRIESVYYYKPTEELLVVVSEKETDRRMTLADLNTVYIEGLDNFRLKIKALNFYNTPYLDVDLETNNETQLTITLLLKQIEGWEEISHEIN